MQQGADPVWLEPMRITGLIAELDTGRPGPCVALRVDLDAVHLQESEDNTHFPFQADFFPKILGVCMAAAMMDMQLLVWFLVFC